MKILVIGGAGYIGSHVTYELCDNGYDVTVLDNLSTGFLENIDKRANFIKGSFSKKNILANILKDVDAVIHLAALKAAGESMDNPINYSKHNIIDTINLINCCLDNNVQNFIFSSSAAVYGIPNYLPVDESHPLNPINYYGFTKLFIEKQLLWYNQLKGLNIALLRYFNAAGADFKAEVGEDHEPETHLIPNIVNSLIKNKVLKVYGKNFNTLDGTGVRDYIHVDDLGYAHILALKKILTTQKSLKLNLGTGKGYSVKQIITEAEKIFKKKIKIKYMPRRAGDVSKLISSSAKAKKALKWKARNSDLKNILITAYNWHKKN